MVQPTLKLNKNNSYNFDISITYDGSCSISDMVCESVGYSLTTHISKFSVIQDIQSWITLNR